MKKTRKFTFMSILMVSIFFLFACGSEGTASTMQLMRTKGEVSVSDSGGNLTK